VTRAEEGLKAAKEAGHPDLVDDAAKLLADMVAIGDHIGIS
ncbi:MAG: F0F1 ATP synthase subunit epsilon, partial [Rhodobacteraceae bacterium]|nr:F0F1 ATP synthase subunit epsilon [Paracoccaceae bacterium]